MGVLGSILYYLIRRINVAMNEVADVILSPIGWLPESLSITLISLMIGILFLVIYKYTSNQQAIIRTRNCIKANMLALRLFPNDLSIVIRTHGRIIRGALGLLFHSLRPMTIMILPISLILIQLSAWYQARPLKPGEKAIVTVILNNDSGMTIPSTKMKSNMGIEVNVGPVRIPSRNEIRWKIQAIESCRSQITFTIGNQTIEKELVIGEGLIPISPVRPSRKWDQILIYPREKPLSNDSVVKAICIDYPKRNSKISGTDWWFIYLFCTSLVFAMIFKPVFKVRI